MGVAPTRRVYTSCAIVFLGVFSILFSLVLQSRTYYEPPNLHTIVKNAVTREQKPLFQKGWHPPNTSVPCTPQPDHVDPDVSAHEQAIFCTFVKNFTAHFTADDRVLRFGREARGQHFAQLSACEGSPEHMLYVAEPPSAHDTHTVTLKEVQ